MASDWPFEIFILFLVPAHPIQIFQIKLSSGFHKVLWFPPPINSYSDITEIVLKVALNTTIPL
jgi:hypothetical protein